jgi:uncharacterized phage protein (TIGR02216 family)
MSEKQAFPWEDVMHLGLGILRWSPTEFWNATPREVMAVFDPSIDRSAGAPALRSDLARLMKCFPDER